MRATIEDQKSQRHVKAPGLPQYASEYKDEHVRTQLRPSNCLSAYPTVMTTCLFVCCLVTHDLRLFRLQRPGKHVAVCWDLLGFPDVLQFVKDARHV